MQNGEELQQKGHNRSRKTTCRERGEKYHFQKGGGGINIVFGLKYRPLCLIFWDVISIGKDGEFIGKLNYFFQITRKHWY
jgi:hypothetical protein